MERLTRAKEWTDSIDLKKELGYKHIWERLLEYEKTDLTPQEVEKLKQKQIPKKIYHDRWVGIDGVPYDLCPNCKTNLCTSGLMPAKKESYCANCGQKLDWGVIYEM